MLNFLKHGRVPRFSYTKRLAVESDALSTIRRLGRSSRPEFRTLTLDTSYCASNGRIEVELGPSRRHLRRFAGGAFCAFSSTATM